MRIGDQVMLRGAAAQGHRDGLDGEVGRVGDLWQDDGVMRCSVVYEGRGVMVYGAPAEDFEAAPGPALH